MHAVAKWITLTAMLAFLMGCRMGTSEADGKVRLRFSGYAGNPAETDLMKALVDDFNRGNPDVFVTSSSDRGQTWSAPVRVNADPIGSGRHQFFVWLAVDPSDGQLHVVYHDRLDAKTSDTRVVLARSEDGGRTWAHTAVPLPAFRTIAEVPFGDYNGIDASDGRVVAAFPHFVADKQVGVSVAIVDR